jgi:uncharacterized protein with GYD domain
MEREMPKYMIEATYTKTGAEGLLKEGGTGRRAAVEKMATDLGGKLEAFYYAFGKTDAYVVVDLPDDTTAVAICMAINASGAATLSTVQLLTAEDIDDAAKKSVNYRRPGA